MDWGEKKDLQRMVKTVEALNKSLKSLARSLEYQNKLLSSYFDRLDQLEQERKDVTTDYIDALSKQSNYSPDEIRKIIRETTLKAIKKEKTDG